MSRASLTVRSGRPCGLPSDGSGLVDDLLAQHAEAVRRAVQARLQAREEIAVVAGVQERHLAVPAAVVLLEQRDRAERLVADLRVHAVLKERPDPVALLADRLAPRAGSEALHEVALPHRRDAGPLVDGAEQHPEQAEMAVLEVCPRVAELVGGRELECRARADQRLPWRGGLFTHGTLLGVSR
jgi:hypothetical protein